MTTEEILRVKSEAILPLQHCKSTVDLECLIPSNAPESFSSHPKHHFNSTQGVTVVLFAEQRPCSFM
uniref:Uncharacterized protein n=1 Tax=Arundo donax TaxID=35708 RepID=A0A0A9G4A1_ARUDO